MTAAHRLARMDGLPAPESSPTALRDTWRSPCVSKQGAAECFTKTTEQLRKLGREGRCCVDQDNSESETEQ